MPSIELNKNQINYVKKVAKDISLDVQQFIDLHSSVSTERALLRLYGVDGVDEQNIPIVNTVVDKLKQQEVINDGITFNIAKAMVHKQRNITEICELICNDAINFKDLPSISKTTLDLTIKSLNKSAIGILERTAKNKQAKIDKLKLGPKPWKYLIVATGNIYEDRTQAKSAVNSGADIIAVIRSTAQSLLDYVPYGATTEGFGGTFATQENFKIMRKALDEASDESGRYVRLVNYSSGLCMAEIAACAAFEDLDMLLNDSMYGVLFRDINIKRTLIDQYFSRLICSKANIIINTGEDNYLTTSDAIESAHTVIASQLINEAMGKTALLDDKLLGLGHAFEINPEVENSFLYELAHAQLSRQLFPNAPLKYMPPTKYKSTDIFFSHCQDAMFNLASVTTGQEIHLAGILTEAIHTPFMQDRAKSLKNINYIFNTAKDLGSEIEFKKDGFIQKRAQEVLDKSEKLLEEISSMGLFKAVSKGVFADIKRSENGGKGLEGVFKKSKQYINPVMNSLTGEKK